MLALLDLAKAAATHKAGANDTTCEACKVNAVAFRDPVACMSLCPRCAANRPTLCELMPMARVPAVVAPKAAKVIAHTDSQGNTLAVTLPAAEILAAAHKVADASESFQLHFAGPQGRGVGDRIKAAGGKWIKENWRMPDTTAARALVCALQMEGRPVTII